MWYRYGDMTRFSSLLVFCSAPLFLGCDPGSGNVDFGGEGGSGGGSTVRPNPLLELPVDPPGTVEMVPPEAGELDPFEQNAALGRGMNLGNALDAPAEGAWGVTLRPYMFQVVAEAGFDSIRLPVSWSTHADEDAPYTIDPEFFERVDWAIAHALTRGLRVVLNIHHYNELYAEPEAHQPRFYALWEQLSEHYQNYPKELYFEVLNEPRSALEPLWNETLAEAFAIIRAKNPGRTVVIGGNEYNKWYTLADVVFPADDNTIATFHYYNPYCFTLQQPAGWDAGCTATPAQNWPVLYPETDADPEATEADQRARLENAMASAATWATSMNLPLYLGEFGVERGVDDPIRAEYIREVARAAERHGMSWAFWELASTMGAFSQSSLEWYPPILEALLPDDEGEPGIGGQGSGGADNGGAGESTAGVTGEGGSGGTGDA